MGKGKGEVGWVFCCFFLYDGGVNCMMVFFGFDDVFEGLFFKSLSNRCGLVWFSDVVGSMISGGLLQLMVVVFAWLKAFALVYS